METPSIRFTAELADVPFAVCCYLPETKACFSDYLTEKEPEFVLDMSEPMALELRKIHEQHWDRQTDPAACFRVAEREPYAEEETLHWMMDRMLSRNGVFHLHSSAICLDGEAYLFTAPSGTGKSTHTRLWREAFGDRVWMINDDMPYLRICEERVRAYGTPWMGKHDLGCNGSAPVRAVAWLTRGEENQIERLDKAQAFPVLMKEVFAFSEKEWITRLTGQIKMLLDRVPFYRLRCNMEPEAAYVAMQAMKSGELR